MTQAYEIIEHSYDVVIVGAGGAGLRCALGIASASARVEEVTASGVRLADGTLIPAELIVWAAGVKTPLTKLDGLGTNRANQLGVLPTLQTTRDPNIFAIGDCAACPWVGHAGKTAPPRAQAPHRQASHLARQLKRLLADRGQTFVSPSGITRSRDRLSKGNRTTLRYPGDSTHEM